MLMDAKTGSIILKVDDPFMIRDLLRKSRLINHPDYNVAVKHTIESAKVLHNIGITIPAPIEAQYSWPGKYVPFAHQRTMAGFLTLHRKAFNLSEMGTAKTNAALWAADYLMTTKRVQKVLILSPLSTLDRVWKQDIFDTLMHRVCAIVHGSREKRMKALNANVDFYIMNHDGVAIKEIADHIHRRPDIDLVIIDEASFFRNHNTKKYKALVKMLRPDQRLWLLTGTPCPNAPTDAWALARLVDPDTVPQFFGSFKRQTMTQITQFKWVPTPNAYAHAFAAMQPAVRFKKSECLDLPPVLYEDRQSAISKEQRVAFNEMKTAMQTEAKSHQITAVNAADKINKIRQILCGAVKDTTTGDYIELPHKERTDVLLDCVREASAKVLIVVPFKGIIKPLARDLGAHYSVAILNGDVTPSTRDLIIKKFKEEKDPHILLCHPKVMSHGLNLTEADMLIFYAPIYSNDEYEQVTERFNRAGQTRKMTVIRIAAHPIEWEIYKMIDNKQKNQQSILNLYKQVVA